MCRKRLSTQETQKKVGREEEVKEKLSEEELARARDVEE